jgi:hypothetical protein
MEIDPQEPIIAEGNKLLIPEGKPKQTREAFFRIMEDRVQRLDKNSYSSVAGYGSVFAHFSSITYKIPEGKLVEDASIYINEDDFRLYGEDFTDLIPIAVRHEIFEMWVYSKNGWSLSPVPKRIGKENRVELAHNLALREEYRFAFEIGKADRYWEFMRRYSQKLPESAQTKFLQENERAFLKAKSWNTRQRK